MTDRDQAANQVVANRLDEVATLLHQQGASPWRNRLAWLAG